MQATSFCCGGAPFAGGEPAPGAGVGEGLGLGVVGAGFGTLGTPAPPGIVPTDPLHGCPGPGLNCPGGHTTPTWPTQKFPDMRGRVYIPAFLYGEVDDCSTRRKSYQADCPPRKPTRNKWAFLAGCHGHRVTFDLPDRQANLTLFIVRQSVLASNRRDIPDSRKRDLMEGVEVSDADPVRLTKIQDRIDHA